MTTQKSRIALIEPGEFRPPPVFYENDVVVSSFGGLLVAAGHIATMGQVIAEVDGIETYRQTQQAGDFEIARSSFVDDAIFTSATALMLRLSIVESGVVTAETKVRFTRNYHQEFQRFNESEHLRRRQRELLNTQRGNTELWQRLGLIAERTSAQKSYFGSIVVKQLVELACEFAAVNQYASMSEDAVLEMFLEADAIPLAKTLPNAYWFSTCMKAAVTVSGHSFQKISKTALEAAISSVAGPIKDKIAEAGRNDASVIAALNAIEGVVLIADGKLIDNPAFA